jgi:hypothetical protein
MGTNPPWRRHEYINPGVLMLCSPLIGPDLQDIGPLPSAQQVYVVYIRNGSTSTFTEVVFFYKRRSLPGVVFLREEVFAPQQIAGFALGLAEDMESYVIGFFLGDELVAQMPPKGDGNMTALRASIYNPDDQDAAGDWWTIEDT